MDLAVPNTGAGDDPKTATAPEQRAARPKPIIYIIYLLLPLAVLQIPLRTDQHLVVAAREIETV